MDTIKKSINSQIGSLEEFKKNSFKNELEKLEELKEKDFIKIENIIEPQFDSKEITQISII